MLLMMHNEEHKFTIVMLILYESLNMLTYTIYICNNCILDNIKHFNYIYIMLISKIYI